MQKPMRLFAGQIVCYLGQRQRRWWHRAIRWATHPLQSCWRIVHWGIRFGSRGKKEPKSECVHIAGIAADSVFACATVGEALTEFEIIPLAESIEGHVVEIYEFPGGLLDDEREAISVACLATRGQPYGIHEILLRGLDKLFGTQDAHLLVAALTAYDPTVATCASIWGYFYHFAVRRAGRVFGVKVGTEDPDDVHDECRKNWTLIWTNREE